MRCAWCEKRIRNGSIPNIELEELRDTYPLKEGELAGMFWPIVGVRNYCYKCLKELMKDIEE